MDISQVTAPTSTLEAAKVNTDSKISSDFETFLKMLTTQIENQDPLEPMKSEEFAVQLATFSSVEQQVRTNELLEAMGRDSQANDLSGFGQWIGREIGAVMPARFDGTPMRFDAPAAVAGTRHELVVKDHLGIEVARLFAQGNGGAVIWDGGTSTGRAPAGLYTGVLESYETGALVAEQPAAAFDLAVEIRQGSEGPVVVTAGGSELAMADVQAVRQTP